MNPLSAIGQTIAAKWAAMTPTQRTFAIALPLSVLVMECPSLIGFLPDDLKKDVQDLCYWTWKGVLAFASWHLIQGEKQTPPYTPPTYGVTTQLGQSAPINGPGVPTGLAK